MKKVYYLFSFWFVFLFLQHFQIIKFGNTLLTFADIFIYLIPFSASQIVLKYIKNNRLINIVIITTIIDTLTFSFVQMFNLYESSIFINYFEHIFGSFNLVFWIYLFFDSKESYRNLFGIYQFLSISALFLFGVTFNEIIELTFDLILKTKTIGPDLFDTNWDLTMNLIGFGIFYLFQKLLFPIINKTYLKGLTSNVKY